MSVFRFCHEISNRASAWPGFSKLPLQVNHGALKITLLEDWTQEISKRLWGPENPVMSAALH